MVARRFGFGGDHSGLRKVLNVTLVYFFRRRAGKHISASMGVAMLSLFVVSARSSPAGQTFYCLECLHGHAECEKDAQHPYDGERALDLQGHRNRRQCRTPQRLSQAN